MRRAETISAYNESFMAPQNLTVVSQPASDADLELVRRVQGGDTAAFEGLVGRHERRLFRTLLGITGNREDAEDGVQNAFMKAYQHLGDFQGASLFSTWLMRIAINEGLERLRRRKATVSLDEEAEEREDFRPLQVRAWEDNPEQFVSKIQIKELVEREVMNLPMIYRVVVMLRDIEEMTTEETATALALGISTVKTRLLRGRLMLREALAPHFMRQRQEAPGV